MAKINDIRFLARETAKEVSGSPRDGMEYLDTASRLYRYPFSDTLLIHAQRPDATACAELEVWNEQMRRWVNRGAKGIALIDDTGPRRTLRYVFDVSDTHPVRGGRTPYLWRLKKEQQEMLLNHLADTYGLSGEDASDLPSALRQIAEEMAADSLEEAMDGIGYAIPGTFLEELDDDTIRVEFRTLLTNSAFYSLARRCGLEPMEYLEEADFSSITDYQRRWGDACTCQQYAEENGAAHGSGVLPAGSGNLCAGTGGGSVMEINQFALYQLKNIPENRMIRYRSYKTLQEQHTLVWYENYEQAYLGRMKKGDTPAGIRKRLEEHPPRSFACHSISVSDVLVLNRAGEITAYYVNIKKILL